MGVLLTGGLFSLAALLTPSATAIGQAPAAPAVPAASAVNLNITPKRLVFDRNTRAGTVYIFNQGSQTATFDIAFVERVMLPNGIIEAVGELRNDPSAQPVIARLASAQPMLVSTPRRVTLAPGRGQTIRIRASQPPGGTGEYRSHLTVATLPPRETGVTAERAQAEGSTQLSFRINSVFGLSIPVILRTGPVDARGEIEGVRIETAMLPSDGTSAAAPAAIVRFDLKRLGANSLFGNIEVRAGRGREVIGLARGVGVYPEIDRRQIQLPLRRLLRRGEQVEITFTDDDSSPGRVIARATAAAP
jgi:hypothetical protein